MHTQSTSDPAHGRRGHRVLLLALVAVLALVAAACGDGEDEVDTAEQVPADQADTDGDGGDDGGDGGEGTLISIIAVDIAYEDAPESVPAGEVTVELVNEGNLEHNFVVEELGDLEVVTTQGGETATGTVTLDEPGEIVYYCSIPGHREAGMEGTLTVT